jgi:rhamnosyltransferase subunit B
LPPNLNVLLPTLGSSGDVNPFVALGIALQARGHRATIITNPIFRAQIESQGLRFLGVGTEQAARRVIADPDLWHVRKSFRIVAEVLIPSLEEMFDVIEANADQNTVMAFSTLSLGARLAQEKLKIRSASVHLQPGIFRSIEEQGMFANLRLSALHPKWFKRMVFRLADVLVLDRHLKGPLNQFRARLGLAPVTRIMHRWLHSPQLVIAFFPSWFSRPQADWPQNMHLVGFPLWDSDPASRIDEAMEFIEKGAPPLIFTPGSAGATMHEFFRESVQAARQLKMRAMLVTNHPEQTPATLPPGIKVFGYLPFSQILPRSALLVHHGGIGTLAQGIKAAVPQLLVPHAHDQFDNAWRLKRLGLGDSIAITSYRAQRAVHAMRGLLSGDAAALKRRHEYAQRIDSGDAIARAVELLERLHGADLNEPVGAMR